MEYIPAKTILTRTKGGSAWFGIDYNMNIYRGCCHGCIYCDSRSECYHIEEFDRVRAKENALFLIRDELRRKIKPGIVGTGAMSDPYNPFEQELCLTRHALELLSAYGFGVAIATKSPLIVRDTDVLGEIRAHSPVLCKITITTVDDALAKKVEPHVASSSERFAAMEKLSSVGIYTGVLLMPVLPFLEDNEENVRAVVRRTAECGGRFVYPAFGMTMRRGQREWYLQKLEELFPGEGLAGKYIRQYGNAYECRSRRAALLWKAFSAECDQWGISYRMNDIIRGYRLGYEENQLRFF